MKPNPNQKLHHDEGQLYTTFFGRPEHIVAFTDGVEDCRVPPDPAAQEEMIAEICKRFNAYARLVQLLDEYVADDENNGMDETGLSLEARALLEELKN